MIEPELNLVIADVQSDCQKAQLSGTFRTNGESVTSDSVDGLRVVIDFALEEQVLSDPCLRSLIGPGWKDVARFSARIMNLHRCRRPEKLPGGGFRG